MVQQSVVMGREFQAGILPFGNRAMPQCCKVTKETKSEPQAAGFSGTTCFHKITNS
jgi:hypothetical protein